MSDSRGCLAFGDKMYPTSPPPAPSSTLHSRQYLAYSHSKHHQHRSSFEILMLSQQVFGQNHTSRPELTATALLQILMQPQRRVQQSIEINTRVAGLFVLSGLYEILADGKSAIVFFVRGTHVYKKALFGGGGSRNERTARPELTRLGRVSLGFGRKMLARPEATRTQALAFNRCSVNLFFGGVPIKQTCESTVYRLNDTRQFSVMFR